MNTSPENKPTIKKPDVLGIVIFLVAITVTIVLVFGDYWPVEKLNRIQIDIFNGSYYPKLTFIITLLVVFLPLVGIKLLIDKMKKKDA
jgi:heme/copper-type cytochrome/quinol oxidase subunit 4